jgi:hypothetical protein
VVPKGTACPDFICYWAAARNLTSGESPYDEVAQRRVQQAYGWDTVDDGLGRYDFLPFYYPPWFAILCAGFLPLGYENARLAWLVLNAEFIFLTGYLLRAAVPGVPRAVPIAVVPIFAFSATAVLVGQTSPLIFLTIVLGWRLLEARRDVAAGVVLGWATMKPQLTAVVLAAILLWAICRTRWRVVAGFFTSLGLLCALSLVLVPNWPREMLSAPARTPPPTAYFPWLGTTWYLLLKGFGLTGWSLAGVYAAVALPMLTVVARTALRRSTALADVLSIALIATYFVAPYGRHYDFPVLLIPLLVLIGTRLSDLAGATVLVTLIVLPYLHFMAMPLLKSASRMPGTLNPEASFVWVPLLLAVLWITVRRAPSQCSDPV